MISKSRELTISVPSRYHLTPGGGLPVTRTVKRTDSPSRTSRVCKRSANCGGIIDAGNRKEIHEGKHGMVYNKRYSTQAIYCYDWLCAMRWGTSILQTSLEGLIGMHYAWYSVILVILWNFTYMLNLSKNIMVSMSVYLCPEHVFQTSTQHDKRWNSEKGAFYLPLGQPLMSLLMISHPPLFLAGKYKQIQPNQSNLPSTCSNIRIWLNNFL